MDERVDRPQAEYAPQSRAPAGRRSRLRLVSGVLILLIAATAGAWLWFHRTPAPAGRGAAGRSLQSAPQPVGAATIGTGDIRIVLNALGTVTPLATVTVMTQINGQLTEVGFQEGQFVKKGDFLAQIDPRPYQVALEQALGTLARDQALLAQAKSDLERYQKLGRQDSIAQQQLSDQYFLVQQYTGTVQTDQALVDNAKLNLAYCRIISPIDGQVGLRQVDPGNFVQTSNTTGIVVITEMQPMSVLFSVPQDNVPDIIKEIRGGAVLSVAAYNQANTTRLAVGQLATLDNLIDTTTGTLRLRALFANPNEELYPNQFVNIRLLVNTLKNVVRVPTPAVQHGAPGTYVYVINADNTVSVRPVTLGPTDEGYEQVISGLQAGERVVTDGTDRLREGAQVTVPAQPAPGQTGSAAGQPGVTKQTGGTGQPGGTGQTTGGTGQPGGTAGSGQGTQPRQRRGSPPAQ